jgi:glycosyltransferase involved in cell wall biosynthesis
LYTGRINFQKGLRELLQAVSMLIKVYTIEIDIVGWEDAGKFSYTEALKKEAKVLGLMDRLHFHGKKKVGDELNSFYRKADIYCIPSYHEGFPRTIWEAMANSLPVIATRVGSIPGYLSEKTTLLIDAKNVNQLREAIEEVITNEHRRKSIIKRKKGRPRKDMNIDGEINKSPEEKKKRGRKKKEIVVEEVKQKKKS